MTITNTDDDRAYKAREERARRHADRLALHIVKSRRDGSYMLVDDMTNGVVAGGYGYAGCELGLDLEDVERALDER